MGVFGFMKLRQPAMELRLVHAELDKQRDRFARKEGTKNTRALVLVGASTLLAGFQTTDAVSPTGIASTVIALVAVSLGILALRPSKGDEVNIGKLERAIRDTPSYRAELILFRSKSKAHVADLEHLKNRSRLVTVGFWLILAGVIFSALQFFWS